MIRVAAAFALFVAVPLAANALQLDDVMRELRGAPERHATFEETKRIALVNGPLVRRGTLDYARPDRLSMRVDTPYFEKIDIAGDALTIERRSGVTRVALGSQPQIAAWVESLRATLAGDGAALAAHFNVSLDGTASQWRLTLVPRDTALAAVIARVVVAGRGSDVLRFEVEEAKGDSSVMVIAPR